MTLNEIPRQLTANQQYNTMPQNQPSTIGQGVQSQTGENILSGECTHKIIQYPATGDWETEFISVALLMAGEADYFHTKAQRMADVCHYLFQRFQRLADQAEQQRRDDQQRQKLSEQWAKHPEPMRPVAGYIPNLMSEMEKKYNIMAACRPASTASEVNELDSKMRDTLTAQIKELPGP
jgi:hypothetical protein